MNPRSRTTATTAVGLALALLAGCTSPGPLASRKTMMGTLRTSVANLEHQNEQLKRELADAQVENRHATDKLVQAESSNDELATKLDDARKAIRGEGGTSLVDSGPGPVAEPVAPSRRQGTRTTPAGRSSRPGRRPPFARIPNRIEDAPALANPDDEPDDTRSSRRDDLGPQSRNDRPSRWLPVGQSERALR